jgi:hypothetical protein
MPLLRILLALALAFALPAQTIRLANLTGDTFGGWKRTTVDRLPAAPAGFLDGCTYVVAGRNGLASWCVDVHAILTPGQTVVLELERATPVDFEIGALPADLFAHFGGLPEVGGVAMQLLAVAPDGAAWTAHFRARHGRMLCTDLWVRWYPGQPGFAHGEALTTCSNPTVPDLTETAGARLTFGDALVVVLGGAELVPPGTVFADGQARGAAITFIWLRHITAQALPSSSVAAAHGIGARGIERLLLDGNPTLPPGFDPRSHVRSLWAESVRRLGTWEPGTLGIPPRSGMTGAQQDQVFTGGETFAIAGTGCEQLTYMAALKWANRPCHHLEADGSPLDPKNHPALRLWDGRAHWHAGVSPDRLGKTGPQWLTYEASQDRDAVTVPGGWWGPDVEHHLINGLAAACRLTGSPLCQRLLEQQTTVYMLQQTHAAGSSTSQAYASRAIGYECLNAVHYWRELANRPLAEKVRDHWRMRWEKVLRPALAGRDFWLDGFAPDRRSGWQQALGCYGLDLAGRVFGVGEAREVALRGAKALVEWDLAQGADGRWRSFGTMRCTTPPTVDPGADNTFYLFGFPLAPATVLRHEPQHARARAIWTQMSGDATLAGHVSWLAPGVAGVQ